MIRPQPREVEPALLRLSRLATLDAGAVAALQAAMANGQLVRCRRELVSEGREISQPMLITSGWATRVRLLADGRRQLISILLPGDLIGMGDHPRPLASSAVMALSDVTLCTPPGPGNSRALAEAYAVSRALEKAYLLAQITRLGRLSAQERIGDFLLELYERLDLAGLASHGSFHLPLTQEALADTLGLTSVHVNRMLQQARREGDLLWKGGRVTLVDPQSLARKVGRVPVRVSAFSPPA